MNKMLKIRSGLGALLLANIISINGSHASGSLELNQEGYQTRIDQLYENYKIAVYNGYQRIISGHYIYYGRSFLHDCIYSFLNSLRKLINVRSC